MQRIPNTAPSQSETLRATREPLCLGRKRATSSHIASLFSRGPSSGPRHFDGRGVSRLAPPGYKARFVVRTGSTRKAEDQLADCLTKSISVVWMRCHRGGRFRNCWQAARNHARFTMQRCHHEGRGLCALWRLFFFSVADVGRTCVMFEHEDHDPPQTPRRIVIPSL